MELTGSQRTVDVHTGWFCPPPPQQCQASHILCKYALLRSFTEAFRPVRSPQILISQVTVVGFQSVCAADTTFQASQIHLEALSLHFLSPLCAVSNFLFL